VLSKLTSDETEEKKSERKNNPSPIGKKYTYKNEMHVDCDLYLHAIVEAF
jgi:hypothetical protein